MNRLITMENAKHTMHREAYPKARKYPKAKEYVKKIRQTKEEREKVK